jgi:hypothetical protein
VELFHILDSYPARSGALTINITGQITPQEVGSTVRYRLNDEPWQKIPQGAPRNPPPAFTIEIDPKRLQGGENCLHFDADKVITPQSGDRACFRYLADSGIPQTMEIDWRTQPLDVQDGYWQTIETSGEFGVQPTPGFEDYDRILNITGAFAGGRRVEATMLFETQTHKGKPYGFGVLPLWGGHQDQAGHFPRRGWAYGLAWYYSMQKGVGAEIASKFADSPFQQIYTYRTYSIEPGRHYQLITEAVPKHSQSRSYQGYEVRMKWWQSDKDEPEEWMLVNDLVARTLPQQDYAVALLAHRAQVLFSSVKITPIPGPRQ